MPGPEPMKLTTLLINEDEKRELQQLARERGTTLSQAFRDGARIVLTKPLTDQPPRGGQGRCGAS